MPHRCGVQSILERREVRQMGDTVHTSYVRGHASELNMLLDECCSTVHVQAVPS
jgi:hypothetical protein